MLMGNSPSFFLCGAQHIFENVSTITITHSLNSLNFLCNVIVGDEIIFDYDLIILNNNSIRIDFNYERTGIVNLLIYNDIGCE